MGNPIIAHEFKGNKFYFNSTPQAEVLIGEIFSDNYHVLQKGIEFLPGDVILDIGACEGMFSIMMAKLFPQTRVIALEPVPRDNHSGGSSAVMTFTSAWQTQMEVDVVDLDQVLSWFNKVKLLKMDIEGMEYDAIYPSKLLNRVEHFVGEF